MCIVNFDNFRHGSRGDRCCLECSDADHASHALLPAQDIVQAFRTLSQQRLVAGCIGSDHARKVFGQTQKGDNEAQEIHKTQGTTSPSRRNKTSERGRLHQENRAGACVNVQPSDAENKNDHQPMQQHANTQVSTPPPPTCPLSTVSSSNNSTGSSSPSSSPSPSPLPPQSPCPQPFAASPGNRPV